MFETFGFSPFSPIINMFISKRVQNELKEFRKELGELSARLDAVEKENRQLCAKLGITSDPSGLNTLDKELLPAQRLPSLSPSELRQEKDAAMAQREWNNAHAFLERLARVTSLSQGEIKEVIHVKLHLADFAGARFSLESLITKFPQSLNDPAVGEMRVRAFIGMAIDHAIDPAERAERKTYGQMALDEIHRVLGLPGCSKERKEEMSKLAAEIKKIFRR